MCVVAELYVNFISLPEGLQYQIHYLKKILKLSVQYCDQESSLKKVIKVFSFIGRYVVRRRI